VQTQKTPKIKSFFLIFNKKFRYDKSRKVDILKTLKKGGVKKEQKIRKCIVTYCFIFNQTRRMLCIKE